MTAPIIPADKWPEWASFHCWDADGASAFFGMRRSCIAWFAECEDSKFPMPTGWDWRVPVIRPSAEQPAVDDDWHLRGYAYASKQATTCACCGEHKHTPLRIDAMGGYVCLTCIDQKLGTLLGEFGYPQPAPAIDLDKIVPAEKKLPELYLAEYHENKGWNACRAKMLALIDGQADRAGDEAITWGTQYPGKAIKLFGAREIAELNWYPDEGADLVGLRVVERVQPTKGEGEADGQ